MYSGTYIVSPTRFHEKKLPTQPLSLLNFAKCLLVCHAVIYTLHPPAGCATYLCIPRSSIYLPKQNNPATKTPCMHARQASSLLNNLLQAYKYHPTT